MAMPDYRKRRSELMARVKGTVFLVSGYEPDYGQFRPDSSFYYYTGLQEPGYILLIDPSGKTQLFVPAFKTSRKDWMVEETPRGFDVITPLGEPISGYQANLYAPKNSYSQLGAALVGIPELFSLSNSLYTQVMLYLAKLGILSSPVHDITALVGHQRSEKDFYEIETIQKAIDITMEAHAAAATIIQPGTYERQIKAGIEYLFTDAGADCAFTSIVATGKNATVLHYNLAADRLQQNDLVVVDIGARKNGYCADLTRTYPASGEFTDRQIDVYDIVLATQDYIARKARPGMFLRNADKPELSLHHLAVRFLEQKGYGKYFIHGIGHHLGIDVHDVADATQPLEEGAIFTIEPGIYIPQERLGIRIEDNYLMTARGVDCLSGDLPKTAEDIEELMAGESDEIESYNDHDEE